MDPCLPPARGVAVGSLAAHLCQEVYKAKLLQTYKAAATALKAKQESESAVAKISNLVNIHPNYSVSYTEIALGVNPQKPVLMCY